jgi:hypothetical protein
MTILNDTDTKTLLKRVYERIPAHTKPHGGQRRTHRHARFDSIGRDSRPRTHPNTADSCTARRAVHDSTPGSRGLQSYGEQQRCECAHSDCATRGAKEGALHRTACDHEARARPDFCDSSTTGVGPGQGVASERAGGAGMGSWDLCIPDPAISRAPLIAASSLRASRLRMTWRRRCWGRSSRLARLKDTRIAHARRHGARAMFQVWVLLVSGSALGGRAGTLTFEPGA